VHDREDCTVRDDDADVLIVGAGLAGLACARTLERAGLSVIVVEAADEVGGRMRTDLVDGFLCDRGFQIVNPAYPALRRLVDLDALELRSFDAGVAVRHDRGLAVLAEQVAVVAPLAARVATQVAQVGDAERELTDLVRASEVVTRIEHVEELLLRLQRDHRLREVGSGHHLVRDLEHCAERYLAAFHERSSLRTEGSRRGWRATGGVLLSARI
jgi:phytoene dehydrogenase-like protein